MTCFISLSAFVTDALVHLILWAESLLLTTPSLTQAGAKFFEMVFFAYVIGFRWCCLTNCFTRPGWATSATSGGLPPAIAVASTVGMSLPLDVYVTLTFGYFALKP